MEYNQNCDIRALKTEYISGTPIIDVKNPRFSWEIYSDEKNGSQKAYKIEVSETENFSEIIWNSGKRNSADTYGITYKGISLKSCCKYYWRVTVWTQNNSEPFISETASFRTGLKYWTADWISPDTVPNSVSAPILRRNFITSDFRSAELYIFSQGWYEAYINGQKVDDRVLSPAYSSKYYLYDTYDLTDILNKGENCIALWLGAGYYSENYSKFAQRWKGPKRVIAEIHITHCDGTKSIIPTNELWKAKPNSAITFNHIYDGEHFDNRLLEPWWEIDFDDSGWEYAKRVSNSPNRKFKPSSAPPLKVNCLLKGKFIKKDSESILVDFGQNFAGWVKIKISGERGSQVCIYHAEAIDENGKLDTFTNRYAVATDIYTLSGEGEETFEPRFTYHGFRYVEIKGCGEKVKLLDICACVVHIGVPITGEFSCDYEPLNKFYSSACWSIRSNAFSVMTDCPSRNERTPCIMDSSPYKTMSTFMWDVEAYWTQWLKENLTKQGTPDWSGQIISIAWHLYKEYGDIQILRDGYSFFKNIINHIESKWNDLIVTERFGDWCAPNQYNNYLTSFSNVSETSTALFYNITNIIAKIAETLGKEEDRKRFSELCSRIAMAYDSKFFDRENGCYGDGSLTPSVLPLYFGMVPNSKQKQVYDSVIDRLQNHNGGHLDTGIYGIHYISMLLGENNDLDKLFDAFFIETAPSFGYQQKMGATTFWEQWNDIKGDMISYNHAMFAGAATVIPKILAGLTCVSNAYRSVKIKPHICSAVNRISFKQHTQQGVYSINWEKSFDTFYLHIIVPFNCTAEVILPNGERTNVGSGTYDFNCKILHDIKGGKQ